MTKQTFLTLALSMLGVAAMAQPRSASEPTLLIKSSQGLMAPVVAKRRQDCSNFRQL